MSVDMWQVAGRYFVVIVVLWAFATLFCWLAIGTYRDMIRPARNLEPAGIVVTMMMIVVVTGTLLLFANIVGPLIHFAIG